ncbi:hypothetical protein [Marinobacter zhanjiangensis]|nr:hypothetical protein [Marinobacter zhanjiangensis]
MKSSRPATRKACREALVFTHADRETGIRQWLQSARNNLPEYNVGEY